MVASLKIKSFFPLSPTVLVASTARKEASRATKRLLIPFIAWTVVYYFIGHNDGTLTYFKNVIASPDLSLWFLLALFYCRILLEVIRGVVSLARIALVKIFKRDVTIFEHPVVALVLIMISFMATGLQPTATA